MYSDPQNEGKKLKKIFCCGLLLAYFWVVRGYIIMM